MRSALLIALAADVACCCLGGCAPQASFVPETIPVNNAELGVMGWTQKAEPQKTAAELVREINFTLKSSPTTRTLET